jgi:hypothetical protein
MKNKLKILLTLVLLALLIVFAKPLALGFDVLRYGSMHYVDLGSPQYKNWGMDKPDVQTHLSDLEKVALYRFPDVSSCLETNDPNFAQEDLYHMKWSAMYTVEDAQVCIFRILSNFKISDADDWFRAQGLSVSEIINIEYSEPQNYYEQSLSATWNNKENGLRWPAMILTPSFLKPYSTNFSSVWSASGKLLYIDVDHNFK